MEPFIIPERVIFGPTTDYSSAKIVVFGVPFEGTTCFLPGTRFGPDTIRDVSWQIESYSIRYNFDMAEAMIYDAGNVNIVAGDVLATLRQVAKAMNSIVTQNKFPVMLGGEHTITWGAIKGLTSGTKRDDFTLLHFDAHMDLRNTWDNTKWSHACVMRRIVEDFPGISLVQFGLRAACKEETNFARNNHNIIQFFSWNHSPEEIIRVVRKINKPVYLTIDVDGFDPSVAPGVGTPEAWGLSLQDVLNVIEPLADMIIGMDIVECTNDILTAALVSRLLVEFISVWCTTNKRCERK